MESVYDILMNAAELLAPRDPETTAMDPVQWSADAHLRASQLRRIAVEEHGYKGKESA